MLQDAHAKKNNFEFLLSVLQYKNVFVPKAQMIFIQAIRAGMEVNSIRSFN